MAMQFVNGELVDDSQDQSNPLAGLNVAGTPQRQGANMGASWNAYEAPDWNKGIDTLGVDLDPNWMKQVGQANNIAPGDWTKGLQAYNDNFSNIQASLPWWQDQSKKRAALSGLGMLPQYKGLQIENYLDRGLETQQQKAVADAYHASHDGKGGGLFGGDNIFGMLALGALGYFALPALMGAGGAGAAAAAETAGLASGGMSFAPEAFSSAFVPNASVAAASAPSFAAGAGGAAGSLGGMDMLSGLDFSPYAGEGVAAGGGGLDYGPGLDTIPKDLTSLFDAANPVLNGYDPGYAETFFGQGAQPNPAHTLSEALSQPLNTTPTTPDPTGIDYPYSDGPMMENATTPGYGSRGLDMQAPAGIRDISTNAGLQDTARLGLKGLKQMTESPFFQIAKTGYNIYNQNQKASQLKDLFNQFKQQSDVGGPFRDLLMRSYTDPNFFKNSPEFMAGLGSFDQQYQANAARNGGRGQLGSAAHNIALDRERARLAGTLRQALAGPASQGPNMQGMAALAGPMANAQANQFNSLLDPQLWKAVSGMFG